MIIVCVSVCVGVCTCVYGNKFDVICYTDIPGTELYHSSVHGDIIFILFVRISILSITGEGRTISLIFSQLNVVFVPIVWITTLTI